MEAEEGVREEAPEGPGRGQAACPVSWPSGRALCAAQNGILTFWGPAPASLCPGGSGGVSEGCCAWDAPPACSGKWLLV